MATQAQLAAGKRYDQTHTKMYCLKLNLETDADIIQHLESNKPMQGYIKKLIRMDIKKGAIKNDV